MKHNETVKTILEELSHIRVYKILYIYIYFQDRERREAEPLP